MERPIDVSDDTNDMRSGLGTGLDHLSTFVYNRAEKVLVRVNLFVLVADRICRTSLIAISHALHHSRCRALSVRNAG